MDFETQQQILADQLRRYQGQAQTQAPQGRMVGRTYVAPHMLEYLAAGLRGVGGMRGEQQTQDQIGELAGKRQSAMVGALKGFQQDMEGQPAREVGANEMDQQGYTVPAVPGNPMAAFGRLTGSGIPELQKAGMQGIASTAQAQQQRAALLADKERERLAKEAQTKQMLTLLEQTKGNPQAAIAAGVPHEVVKAFYESSNYGREKVNFQDVGGSKVPVTEYGTTPQGIAPLVKTSGPANLASDLLIPDPANPAKMIPNTQLIGVKTGLAQSGAARNSTTVINAGPKEFEKELGKLDAEQLGKWRDLAAAGQSLKGTVEQLKEAEKMGAYSGGGADARLAVANLVEGWTGLTPKGVVGSQLYNAEANKLILDRVKALGANPSNADREFLQKTVPQLATNAQARQQMIQWMEKQADSAIARYRDADAYARKNSGLKGFDMFPLPVTPSPAGAPKRIKLDAQGNVIP